LGRPRKKQRDQLLAKHFLTLSEEEEEEEEERKKERTNVGDGVGKKEK
jgi:hypothetical protein